MRLIFSVFAEKKYGNIESSIDGDFTMNMMTFALKDICLSVIRNQERLSQQYADNGFLKINSSLDENNLGGLRKDEDEIKTLLLSITYEEFKNDFVALKQTLLNFPNVLYDEVIVPKEQALKYCDVILGALNPDTFKEILIVGKDNLEYFYGHIFPKIETTSSVKIESKGFTIDEIKALLDKFYFSFPIELRDRVRIDFKNLTCKTI